MDISTKIQQPAGNFSNMWTEKTSLTYRINIKIFLNGLQATSTLTHTYMSVLNLCESQKRSCEPDTPTKKKPGCIMLPDIGHLSQPSSP